jgi:beta-lactamase class A
MPVNPGASLKDLLTTSGSVRLSLALFDFASRAQLLVKPDELYHPASTFKIGVMMEVYHQAFLGEYTLSDQIPIKNEFESIADGSLFSCDPEDDSEKELYSLIGKSLPLRDIVRRMIVSSSNLATNILVEKTGAERVTQFMHDLGAKDLLVLRGPEDDKAFARGLNNSATARSLMLILVRLAMLEVVSPTASQEMIDILLQQQFNDGIPAHLPAGVKTAHKTGWTDGLYHDAGIVYPPGRDPYVLVIMTEGVPDVEAAHELVAALSEKVFHQLVAAV